MIIDESQGLNAGLNKKAGGSKVGNFLRKNVNTKQISINNAVKVGTLASSFVPAGGAVGIASKLAKLGKVGRLANKAIALTKTPVGQMVMTKVQQGVALNTADQQVVTQIAVAQDTDASTPNVMTANQFDAVTAGTGLTQADAPTIATPVSKATPTPTEAQINTIAEAKGLPVEDVKEELATQEAVTKAETPTASTPVKKDNKMLYIGLGAVALIGVIAMASKGTTSTVTAK